MGFFIYNFLFNIFTLLSISFSSFARTFNVLLVVLLSLSTVTNMSRLSHFLTFSRLTVTCDLIGLHHVTKNYFLDFQDTVAQQPTMIQFHMTCIYEIFLCSGVNLEGNNN